MALTRSRVVLLVGALLIGLLLAGVPRWQQAQAATSPSPSGDTAFWRFSKDGFEVAQFTDCTGFGSRSEIIEYRPGGGGDVQKAPGETKVSDVTCSRSPSANLELSAMRAAVEDGDLGAVRGSYVFERFNTSGVVVERWTLRNAFPSELARAFDREVMVFTSEAAERSAP